MSWNDKVVIKNIYNTASYKQESLSTLNSIHAKMDSNENPIGASYLALEAAQKALQNIHLYPDKTYLNLKRKLADYYGLNEKQFIIGNGSDSVIEILFRCFLNINSEIIISQNEFVSISYLAKLFHSTIKIIPMQSWRYDLNSFMKAISDRTSIIFFSNPNNPIGNYITHIELLDLFNKIPENVLIILDEAYYEYTSAPDFADSIKLLNCFNNLFITRTFSKFYGLAGLRVGYGIGHENLIQFLERAHLPFLVNRIAIDAAIAALEDTAHQAKTRNVNSSGKIYLETSFCELQLNFFSSQTNFITINFHEDVRVLSLYLLEKGVLTKTLYEYDLPNCLRITIGTMEQNINIIHFLRNFFD